MPPRVTPPPSSTPGAATILLGGDDTGGQFALVHLHCLAGTEPPLRRHHREDLVVHVLRGDLRVTIDGVYHPLPAGATALIPSGCEHGYRLRSATADLLVVLTPAGAEACLGDLVGGCLRPGAASLEQVVIAAAHHGIEITGPAPCAAPD